MGKVTIAAPPGPDDPIFAEGPRHLVRGQWSDDRLVAWLAENRGILDPLLWPQPAADYPAHPIR